MVIPQNINRYIPTPISILVLIISPIILSDCFSSDKSSIITMSVESKDANIIPTLSLLLIGLFNSDRTDKIMHKVKSMIVNQPFPFESIPFSVVFTNKKS